MKTKFISTIFTVASLTLVSQSAIAGYPMISDIPNQKIMMNSSTPIIRFTVTDDTTSAADLVISFKSLNTDLIPQSASNVILGGRGSTRTVRIIPARDKADMGTVLIIVTDSDGDQNNDAFEIEVDAPPQCRVLPNTYPVK